MQRQNDTLWMVLRIIGGLVGLKLAAICGEALVTAWAAGRFGAYSSAVTIVLVAGTLLLPLSAGRIIRSFRRTDPDDAFGAAASGTPASAPLWLWGTALIGLVCAVFSLRLLFLAISADD